MEFRETRVWAERGGGEDPMVHQPQGAQHRQLAEAPHGEAEVVVGVSLAKEAARVEMLVLGVLIGQADLEGGKRRWELEVLQGVREGRGGLGTVYVFSAGNGGALENSNLDGYVNKLGVNAICAVSADGRVPSYSEAGANLLVCGPSSGSASTGSAEPTAWPRLTQPRSASRTGSNTSSASSRYPTSANQM